MKLFMFAWATILSLALALEAHAQRGGCQGGGGTTTTSTTGTVTAGPTFVPAIASLALASQSVEQAYLRQMQLASMQAAYFAQMRQAYEHGQAVAQQKEARRQQRLAARRERREAELARRQELVAKNRGLGDTTRKLAIR
jgi:hypothetical protein